MLRRWRHRGCHACQRPFGSRIETWVEGKARCTLRLGATGRHKVEVRNFGARYFDLTVRPHFDADVFAYLDKTPLVAACRPEMRRSQLMLDVAIRSLADAPPERALQLHQMKLDVTRRGKHGPVEPLGPVILRVRISE
jgi:hypothetical protein